MIYCFDIDGTICSLTLKNRYDLAVPFVDVVADINRLYSDGHKIVLFTARGKSSNIDWKETTVSQLREWGVNYHELLIGLKPSWDIFVDDKAESSEVYRSRLPRVVGLIAGCFDVLHYGYILMFRDAKTVCNHLVVALHEDPSLERPEKAKPVHSLEERADILRSLRYVDEVIPYRTESDLDKIGRTRKIDVRIVGSDYRGREDRIVAKGDRVYFHLRDHGWSSTRFKSELVKRGMRVSK